MVATAPIIKERAIEAADDGAPEEAPASPVDARGVAITVIAVGAAILLAQYMQSVLIPFVLAGLVFYALDPLVDRLQQHHVPRALGAGLAIGLVVTAVGGGSYLFADDALRVVEELPSAAQQLRAKWAANINHEPTAIDKVQEAARAIGETAAAAATPNQHRAARRRPRADRSAGIPGCRLSFLQLGGAC